ncbi:MAG: purine-nucleoside phosphorylase [Ktedonobacteraceae bacterium]|nr:purine-nucleoside phosphorylase [Ktedonobacteraceae bacterium]
MLYDQVIEAAAAIRASSNLRPTLALILGSGLGDLANELEQAVAIAYADIPHFVHSTVASHAGRLLLGWLENMPVVVMQGRFHLYEGYAPHVVTLPVRVMRMLGAEVLLVTNAAGGVNPAYCPGDFMLIRDHIYMPGLAGLSPLVGQDDVRLGERFPSLTLAYEPQLRAAARVVAAGQNVTLHEGVYTMVGGSNFETSAELKYLRVIGTDAVGMSTALEVIVARQVGMRVLGISLITNSATGSETGEVSHTSVVEAAKAVRTAFSALIRGIVREIANRSSEP